MTHPLRLTLALAALALAVSAPTASAQGPISPGYRPPVSPYLNLLRGGNPTYLNYYGLVRPQLDAQQSFQSLQGQVQTLGAAQSTAVGIDGQTLPATGQPFGYFNHRSYFLNNRGGSGGGIGGVGGRSGGGNMGGGNFGGGNLGNRGLNTGNQSVRPQGIGNFR